MGIGSIFKKTSDPQPIAPSKPLVLVAEDEEYLRDFYQELMQGEGYEVVTAVNGQEALNLAIQKLPKVILLDIMMPVMDGMQVLEQLKKNEQTKSIPVIVLTNAGNIENIETAKYHKAFKFLIKSNIVPRELITSAKDAILYKGTDLS